MSDEIETDGSKSLGFSRPEIARDANVVDAVKGGPWDPSNTILPGTRAEQRLRRNTFDRHGWTKHNNTQNPDDLAEAGLYYEGNGDTVRCQYCNGTLCKWKPGDKPLQEHKRLYPDCPFGRNMKA